MEKLKNNKGISLASVLITVVLMIIILSSIIYSNSRTNEIKEAMLINSDIEELTKKVEMYYLEKGTLPLLEDANYNYNTTTERGTNVIYYKLQISLLDNLNLNNKENIQTNNLLTENDQWYVINKQTHTIYFVKYINGEKNLQTAAYSNQYSNIINQAETKGVFNTTGIGSSVNNTIELTLVTDSTSDVSGGLDVRDNGNSTGDKITPEETSGSGKANYTYANYVGWDETGTTATNLVLQYDGEYNAGKTGTYHNTSATTWTDLTGNGNTGYFGQGTSQYTVALSNVYEVYGYTDFKYGTASKTDNRENSGSLSYSWNNKNIKLSSNSYIFNTALKNIPNGSANYTIEIVLYYDGNTTERGFLGYGIYNIVSWPSSISSLTNVTNTKKYSALAYGYRQKVYTGSNFRLFYVSGSGNYPTMSLDTNAYGKAIALKTNSSKRNIVRL